MICEAKSSRLDCRTLVALADSEWLVGVTFLACMGAALVVVPWTKAVRKLSVLVEFSTFWKARLFLVLIGAFWVVRTSIHLDALQHVQSPECRCKSCRTLPAHLLSEHIGLDF